MSMIDFTTNIKKILKTWAVNQLHVILAICWSKGSWFFETIDQKAIFGVPQAFVSKQD